MSRKRRTAADEPFLVVRSSATDLKGGEIIEEHAHPWHQLIYVSQGVLFVQTEAGSWVAPPSWAIWAPAGVRHSIRFIGDCAFRTLYVRPGWRPVAPERCCVVTVSALLRELILRIAALHMLDERDATETAIAMVALDELRHSDVPPFALPQPTSDQTRRAAALIVEHGPEAATLDKLAREVGLGARTLERRFLAETGLPLGRWRQHQGLLRALEHLAVGEPVKTVAASAGYANASAFIAAFRNFFGTTPARYFERG
jgi:AraC-like DNA-binding protein